MIAALFVATGGCYFGLDGVDPWDEKRDARLYAGPWPVVAHPPCSRWCRLAGLVEARWGHKRGEDGGCFASALDSVRRFGGVLEHPAFSDAWAAHDLNEPSGDQGWSRADWLGGWSCYVEQGHYGHRARKATWLYAFGCELPRLAWGKSKPGQHQAWVGGYLLGNKALRGTDSESAERAARARPHISRRESLGTPVRFRDMLIDIARSSR